MTTKLHLFTFAGALLLGGCGLSEDQFDDFDDLDGLDEAVGPTGPIGDPAAAIDAQNHADPYLGTPIIPTECIGAAVVGILNSPEGSCGLRELPGDWTWTPMFELGSPQLTQLSGSMSVPEEFEKFCVFEWVGAQPLEDDGQYSAILSAIDEYPHMDLDSVAVDCLGMKEQGDLNDPSVLQALADAFQTNIGIVEAGDISGTEMNQAPVRMAVLDSVSQDAVDNGLLPHNEHGTFISSLIRDIACPTGDPICVDNLTHVLVLPREDYLLPDYTIGKDYGSQVDLAKHIYYAVQNWRKDRLLGLDNDERLVINLSVGFSVDGQGVEALDRGPGASLYTALQFASCHGALVFAASGNLRDEACPTIEHGPLAPGSFEGIPAPTQLECAAMGFEPDNEIEYPVFPPASMERPLLYAVGGTDAFDQPLPNAIDGSLPQLVATGSQGIASNGTQALTGSSISTAVASGTAMLIWMYNPHLRPDEVYDMIYGGGFGLGVSSDFGLGGGGAEQRRISVCAALELACIGNPNCPSTGGCEAHPPESDGNLGSYANAVQMILADPGTTIHEHTAGAIPPVCDATPLTQIVIPMPEVPICAHCSVDIGKAAVADDDRVYMTVDASYKGWIFAASLYLENAAGTVQNIAFDAATINSLNDPLADVTKVTFDAPETASATLTFWLWDGSNQSNPVPLI